MKPPKTSSSPAACYDEEQIIVMLSALEEEELKYQVMIQVALFAGLRRGELMGLEWSDVDFEAGTLEVRQAIYPVREHSRSHQKQNHRSGFYPCHHSLWTCLSGTRKSKQKGS